MKQTNTSSVLLVLLLLSLEGMVACKQNTDTNHQSNQSDVQLNDGKRWQANPETTQGIDAMIILVDTYLTKSTPELPQLRENLLNELTLILQKCTMKGEAHDQLHNYLLPLKGKIEALGNSDDVQTVEDIKIYLETYKDYFE